MKPCPYCKGWIENDEHSISLVETHVNNFQNSQAAECDYCGLRAMSADINDGDEQAFKFWDDLVDVINFAMGIAIIVSKGKLL